MPATETAELVGGPWDGGRLPVERGHAEALVWWRGGESIDADTSALDLILLKYPTRHGYRRTDRRTAGGATVFRHQGRLMGLFT